MKKQTQNFSLCKEQNPDTCGKCRKSVVPRSFFFHLVGTVVKTAVGILSGSQALIADAVHSLTDTFAFGVNFIGTLSAMGTEFGRHVLVGSIMFLCGVWICADNVAVLAAGTPAHPGLFGLVVAALSVIMNIYLYNLSKCAVVTDAENREIYLCMVQNRTNFFSAFFAFTGILLADLGLVYFDPLFAFCIGLFQFKGAVEIFKQGHLSAGLTAPRALNNITVTLGILTSCVVVFFSLNIHEILSRRAVIMVPARAPAAGADVSTLLGRSQYFYIIDTRARCSIVVVNQMRNVNAEVSSSLLKIVKENGVGVILAQKIGAEVFSDLTNANVRMYYLDAPTTVSGAVDLYQNGRLGVAFSSNVQRGFGRSRVKWLSPW